MSWAKSLSGDDRTAAFSAVAVDWLAKGPEEATDFLTNLTPENLNSQFLNHAAVHFSKAPVSALKSWIICRRVSSVAEPPPPWLSSGSKRETPHRSSGLHIRYAPGKFPIPDRQQLGLKKSTHRRELNGTCNPSLPAERFPSINHPEARIPKS